MSCAISSRRSSTWRFAAMVSTCCSSPASPTAKRRPTSGLEHYRRGAGAVMELGIRPEPPQINSALPPLLGGGSNRAMSALSPESTVIPVNGIPRTRIKFRNFNRRFSSRSLDGTICLNYGRKPDEETYFNSCYVFGVSCDHHRFLSRGERDCPNSGPDCSISGVAMCWFERRCCNFCLYRGNQAKLRKLEIIQ